MHLGNGAITPECAVVGFCAAATGLGYLWRSAGRAAPRVSLAGAAALGGLVFAAQMINVPVLETASAHLVGGVLLAELLGPAVGATAMAAILLVQALFLGDGGLAALGVNVVNMALLPAGLVAGMRRFTTAESPRSLLTIGGAAAASIPLAVMLIAGEVAFARATAELVDWPRFVAALIATHSPVLFLEAAATVALVFAWRKLSSGSQAPWALSAATAALALLLAGLAWGISSGLPDGYESAADTARMGQLLSDDVNVIAATGALNASLHEAQSWLVDSLARIFSSEAVLALASTAIAALLIGAFARLIEALARSRALAGEVR